MQRVFYISEDTKDTGEQANEVKRVGNILMYRGTRFLRLKLNYMSCDAQYANNRHRYTKPKDIQTINIPDSFIHVPYNPQSDFRLNPIKFPQILFHSSLQTRRARGKKSMISLAIAAVFHHISMSYFYYRSRSVNTLQVSHIRRRA